MDTKGERGTDVSEETDMCTWTGVMDVEVDAEL